MTAEAVSRSPEVDVRVVITEPRRFEINILVSADLTDEELRTRIDMARESGRCLELPPADNDDYRVRTVEVTRPDGQVGAVNLFDATSDCLSSRAGESVLDRCLTRAKGETPPMDYGDLVDSIDERLAEGPEWPALNAALNRAAAAGYDVEARLPALAAQEPLPVRQPAQELHYRLLADCDAALSTPSGPDPTRSSPNTASQNARRAELQSHSLDRGDNSPPR